MITSHNVMEVYIYPIIIIIIILNHTYNRAFHL